MSGERENRERTCLVGMSSEQIFSFLFAESLHGVEMRVRSGEYEVQIMNTLSLAGDFGFGIRVAQFMDIVILHGVYGVGGNLGLAKVINTLAVVLVLVISIMASFACKRMYWKLKGFVSILLVMGMMIPIHATLLPNYVIYDRLRLTDTIWALLIPYVAFSLPQGFFLTSSFMDSIPRELEEAALIDGCGIYRVVAIIITPLMKASISTVAIMTYLNNWNEFIMATTYLSSAAWKTLPFCILEFTGQYSSNYAVQFAVMALSAAPAIIVYVILNKHITKGVAMGAVKG